jgi:hypothetical protein
LHIPFVSFDARYFSLRINLIWRYRFCMPHLLFI